MQNTTQKKALAKKAMKQFINDFQKNHLMKLNQAHLNIVLLKKQQVFIGTKTLSIALKFIS